MRKMLLAKGEEAWWKTTEGRPTVSVHDTGWSYMSVWAFNTFVDRMVASNKPIVRGSASGYVKKGSDLVGITNTLISKMGGSLLSKVLGTCGDEMCTSGDEMLIAWPQAVVRYSTYPEEMHATLNIMSSNEKFAQRVLSAFRKATVQRQPVRMRHGRVYVMGYTPNGVRFFNIGFAAVPINRTNYTDDVVTAFDSICAELNSSTPSGRLTILDGPPGTGKTYLIRGVMDAVANGMFIFVPPTMISQLGDPSLITALLELGEGRKSGPSIFVLEDADQCLVERNTMNMNNISALLNLTSGIMGELLDIRVIASSNAERVEIDNALRRPGRLSEQITIGPLTDEQARTIFCELTGMGTVPTSWITGNFTLADIYKLARQHGWVPPATKQVAPGGRYPFAVKEEAADITIGSVLGNTLQLTYNNGWKVKASS